MCCSVCVFWFGGRDRKLKKKKGEKRGIDGFITSSSTDIRSMCRSKVILLNNTFNFCTFNLLFCKRMKKQ